MFAWMAYGIAAACWLLAPSTSTSGKHEANTRDQTICRSVCLPGSNGGHSQSIRLLPKIPVIEDVSTSIRISSLLKFSRHTSGDHVQ